MRLFKENPEPESVGLHFLCPKEKREVYQIPHNSMKGSRQLEQAIENSVSIA
jgi:hypothetical protein